MELKLSNKFRTHKTHLECYEHFNERLSSRYGLNIDFDYYMDICKNYKYYPLYKMGINKRFAITNIKNNWCLIIVQLNPNEIPKLLTTIAFTLNFLIWPKPFFCKINNLTKEKYWSKVYRFYNIIEEKIKYIKNHENFFKESEIKILPIILQSHCFKMYKNEFNIFYIMQRTNKKRNRNSSKTFNSFHHYLKNVDNDNNGNIDKVKLEMIINNSLDIIKKEWKFKTF